MIALLDYFVPLQTKYFKGSCIRMHFCGSHMKLGQSLLYSFALAILKNAIVLNTGIPKLQNFGDAKDIRLR